MPASLLIVDDEPTFRVLAQEALLAEGFHVRTASNLKKARAEWDAAMPDVVILDRRLPDGDGLDFLKQIRSEGASPIVVMVTAYADISHAVEALRAGAWDYLSKPVQLADLVVKLAKVLETRGLHDRLAVARDNRRAPAFVAPRSAAMRSVMQRIAHVASSPQTPVFLAGPSGAGKQFVAETLHAQTYAAQDPDAPFVEVNCAALPDDLVESELFGHERGAFTDARSARRGLIEMASKGTLFLDEVTELPLRSQAKLLKVIDTMRFRRLGGEREIEVSLRIVAASNVNMASAVREGRFREDLFHRLAVFTVEIPPLAARPEDIPELALTFLAFFARRTRKALHGLTPDANEALVRYTYPGNVRELRNIMERATILSTGPDVTAKDLMLEPPCGAVVSAPERPFFAIYPCSDGTPPLVRDVERAYVAHILQHVHGQRMAAAEALGISYPTLLKRLRELELDEREPADPNRT